MDVTVNVTSGQRLNRQPNTNALNRVEHNMLIDYIRAHKGATLVEYIHYLMENSQLVTAKKLLEKNEMILTF